MDVLKGLSLDYAVGQSNMGGTRGKLYYVPATHVKTWPEFEVDGVTLKTAPVLLTGKQWFEVYFTKDTGSVNNKKVGELDAGSWETTAKFFHPKVRSELVQLVNVFTNGPFILVMKDGNGIQRVVGSPELGAYLTEGDVDGGMAAKDRNGASFTFVASSPTPAPICEFPISLTVAV